MLAMGVQVGEKVPGRRWSLVCVSPSSKMAKSFIKRGSPLSGEMGKL